MTKKRIISLVTISLALTASILLTGCSNNDQAETTKVRIADLPVVQALPLYLAMEKGYFEEAGIEVEYVRLNSPNLIIDALLSKKVDMTSPSGALGITGIASLKKPGALKIYAASGGDKIIANDSILVGIDSEIQSISELKGKSLGILPGIQWRTVAKHILSKNNLVAGEDVTIVELAPALQAPALQSKQIDALLAIEPMPTIVKEKGIGKEIVHAPTAQYVADPFYGGAGVIRTEFVEKNPELAAKIMDILKKSIEEIRKNPDSAKQYLKGYTPLDENLISKAPVLLFKMYDELTEKDMRAIQDFYDIFSAHKVIDGKINAKDLIYSPQQ